MIFIHGFPDSWVEWRHIIASQELQNAATLVAIDLPGYGGTQSLEKYSATNLLERLTELIIALRVQYGVENGSESNLKKTIVVAHDWGCLLSMRLASEAPSLAHRFILTNAPLVSCGKLNFNQAYYDYHSLSLDQLGQVQHLALAFISAENA